MQLSIIRERDSSQLPTRLAHTGPALHWLSAHVGLHTVRESHRRAVLCAARSSLAHTNRRRTAQSRFFCFFFLEVRASNATNNHLWLWPSLWRTIAPPKRGEEEAANGAKANGAKAPFALSALPFVRPTTTTHIHIHTNTTRAVGNNASANKSSRLASSLG